MPLWKRLVRIFIAVTTLVAVLFGCGLIALDWYLGSNTLKEQVQELVSERTGLDMVFTGELGVSIYPYIGLETGPIVAPQPPGYGDGEMIRASSIVTKISLLALLHRVIDFEIVSLEDLELHIVQKQDGSTNLDALGRVAGGQGEAPRFSWQGFEVSSFSIKGLRLDNGHVRYSNLADGTELVADTIQLRTGIVRLDEPTDFIFEAHLEWPQKEMRAEVHWMGELLAAPGLNWVVVPESGLQIVFDAPVLGNETGQSHFTADLALDTRNASFALKKFKLGIPEILLAGNVEGTELLHAPKVTGNLAAAQFTVTTVLNHYLGDLIPPKDPGIFQDGSFSFDFQVDDSNLYVSNLDVLCDKTRLRGTFSALDFDDPLFKFAIVGDELDFDRYYRLFIVDEPFILQDFGPEFLGRVHSEGSLKLDEVVLASGEFKDFQLGVSSENGTARLKLERGRLWDGDASGELTVNIRHEGGEDHPLSLDASFAVARGAASLMPILNGEGRVFQGRGKASYSFTMPETMFKKSTNIDEVLRYSSFGVAYEIGSGVLKQGKRRGQKKQTVFDSIRARAKFVATGKQYPAGEYGYRAGVSIKAQSESEPYMLAVQLNGPVRVSNALDSVRLVNTQLGIQLSGKYLPPGETMLVVHTQLSMDTAKQTLKATKTTLEANAGTVRGSFTGHRIFEKDYTYVGPVSFTSHPRLVFGLLDVEIGATRDEDVLRSFSGGFDLALMPNAAVLANIDVLFDDTKGTGKIHIEDFETGHSTFELHADQLDINRYRPPKKKRIPGKCGEPKLPPVPLPLRTLSSADVDGEIFVGDFRIFDISFKSLRSHATMKGGKIELPNLRSDFYGGAMTGAFYGTATRKKLDCDMALKAESFNGGDFMIDVARKQYVDGDTTMSFTIHTEGATDDAFIANMAGKAAMSIVDGSYRFSGEQNPPKGSKPTDYIQNKRTGFDRATATFHVDQSVFSSEDFRMESSYLSAVGGGNFNLDKDTIDLHLEAEYVIVPTVIPIYIVDCLHDPGVSIPSVEIIGNTMREILGLPLRPFQYLRDLLF